MINFIKRTNIFLSGFLGTVTIAIVLLAVFGLQPGIDFTGGTIVNVSGVTDRDAFDSSLQALDVTAGSIVESDNGLVVKLEFMEEDVWNSLSTDLKSEFQDYSTESFEAIGPVLGNELIQKMLAAVLVTVVSLLFYIAWRFKDRVFGVAAILALIHDVLVILGAFAVFGKLFNVEVDVLFVTATLTAIAFSVHDTIVLFDRVREVRRRQPKIEYGEAINTAINQTLVRSLSTSLSILFVLISLLVLGGESIRWFVVALLVGTISGAYSSPFIAAPLTVWWHRRVNSKSKKK
ncbi:protein translocase subunit SecF [bacterium]|uniref:Protein-export membrane protein SecF n=2 Tax=Katanobacteria TaxID=422282 RepID=A0A2M7X211_UNCKA|nr:protein translocase subunit SecF [bacterium]PIP56333.1 MAG: protein translocase subunit SecF [candidate division WWE3 bacterium CG22_combo_CG10-13_8_21_14_all_39_12]PJA40205.1 MAG: protein translocase subunit SecF [candidate division WWE3 bacterium CG_4_9_14_3_um_filter_39_7]